MFIAFVRTVIDSIADPIIQNAFLECSSTLKIVFGAATIFLVGEVRTVRVAIAEEILVDALLLIIAFNLSVVAFSFAVCLVTPIEAMIRAITRVRVLNALAIGALEFRL